MTVLVDAGPRGLVALPRRRRDALLARLRSDTLDARLAAGEAPEADRLLAVRADQLTNPAARRRLACCWEDLAARARRPRGPSAPRLPIRRSRIVAADPAIRLLVETLRTRRPAAARGVAIATTLLTTPPSPVYQSSGDTDELVVLLDRAVAAM